MSEPTRKPLQHKTVREVAAEVVQPVEARMTGMEDWLTVNSTTVRAELLRHQQELNDIRARILDAQLRLIPLENPWYVRLWAWVKRKVPR